MSDKLPKVSIAVVGIVIAQIGGFIWWTAQQASTISNLEDTVNVLTVENNATDKTNLIRDVEQNKENIEEMIEILAEFYEDMEDADNEIWEDIDMINDDMGGMASHNDGNCQSSSSRKVFGKHVRIPYKISRTFRCEITYIGENYEF